MARVVEMYVSLSEVTDSVLGKPEKFFFGGRSLMQAEFLNYSTDSIILLVMVTKTTIFDTSTCEKDK